MRFIVICISISLCILLAGCKRGTSSSKETSRNSTEDMEERLETLCLSSRNTSITFSMKKQDGGDICEYHYRYLGVLQVHQQDFEALQKTVLSGQDRDALRASVFIRFFSNGKLYGEYAGLNNFHAIKVASNTISIYNSTTRSTAKFEIKDSIPRQLFFPYNNKDSSSTGDLFYFNKYINTSSADD